MSNKQPLEWRWHAWRSLRREEVSDWPQSIEQFRRHPVAGPNWISITDLAPFDQRVLCGMTSYVGELLVAFDPDSGCFEELGFQKVAEPWDIKEHRGLTRAHDGSFYFGVASLVEPGECNDVPGGRVFRWDPATGEYQALGRPVPHSYLQSILLDEKRRRVYGNTYPIRGFYDLDLNSGDVIFFYTENQPDGPPAMDPDGRVWSMYSHNLGQVHYLCCYDPDSRRMDWTGMRLPAQQRGQKVVAGYFYYWREHLYMGTLIGHLMRLDTHNRIVEDLGSPDPQMSRISCLIQGPDGLLYGTCGDNNGAWRLFSFDGEQFVDWGLIQDQQGDSPYIVHGIIFHGNRIYACETDNPIRSGYLWWADWPQ